MEILEYWQIITSVIMLAVGVGIFITKTKGLRTEVEALKTIQIGMSGRIDKNREDSIRQDERIKYLDNGLKTAVEELKTMEKEVYTAIKDLTTEMHNGHQELNKQIMKVLNK